MDFTSAKGIRSTGKTTREHVEHNAIEVTRELFRRVERDERVGVIVELAKTNCTCGSGEAHPDLHFVIVVGGPFPSEKAAMDALANVASQQQLILRNHKALGLSGKDITGG